MPCDQIRTMTVDLALADPALLAAALESMGATRTNGGHRVAIDGTTYDVRGGRLTNYNGDEEETEEAARKIRVAYAQATVRKVAKKYGWALGKQTTGADGSITIKATK